MLISPGLNLICAMLFWIISPSSWSHCNHRSPPYLSVMSLGGGSPMDGCHFGLKYKRGMTGECSDTQLHWQIEAKSRAGVKRREMKTDMFNYKPWVAWPPETSNTSSWLGKGIWNRVKKPEGDLQWSDQPYSKLHNICKYQSYTHSHMLF